VAIAGWADLYAWHVDRAGDMPLFRQVYVQIRSAILSRSLAPGTRLPSTRELSSHLRMSRSSVLSAYEQLLAEGYISGKARSGTYISFDLPVTFDKQPARLPRPLTTSAPLSPRVVTMERADGVIRDIDARPFNMGRTRIDARTADAWRRVTLQAVRSLAPVHLGYSDPQGLPEVREAISDYLRAARGLRCAPEQVIVTGGTQPAIDLTIRVLLGRDVTVAVEDPCYPPTYNALASAGVEICPVPVDAQGIDVAAAKRTARKARAIFVTSSHQFPLGVALAMSRRLQLLEWARESSAWIVEDDYASEFRYSGRPLPALQGLDEAGRTIYIGTFNKALFPGLRLGYLVVPSELRRPFTEARRLIDRQPSTLDQTIIGEFMRQGYLAAHIRRMRLQYRDQRDVLVAELRRHVGAHATVQVPDQGMHLIVYLSRGISDSAVAARALAAGIVTRPLRELYKDAPARSGLMLGFSGYPCEVIAPAARRLASIITAARAALPSVRRTRGSC
jgi:GntR family transcriptional regulator / MocR family aminotransferase